MSRKSSGMSINTRPRNESPSVKYPTYTRKSGNYVMTVRELTDIEGEVDFEQTQAEEKRKSSLPFNLFSVNHQTFAQANFTKNEIGLRARTLEFQDSEAEARYVLDLNARIETSLKKLSIIAVCATVFYSLFMLVEMFMKTFILSTTASLLYLICHLSLKTRLVKRPSFVPIVWSYLYISTIALLTLVFYIRNYQFISFVIPSIYQIFAILVRQPFPLFMKITAFCTCLQAFFVLLYMDNIAIIPSLMQIFVVLACAIPLSYHTERIDRGLFWMRENSRKSAKNMLIQQRQIASILASLYPIPVAKLLIDQDCDKYFQSSSCYVAMIQIQQADKGDAKPFGAFISSDAADCVVTVLKRHGFSTISSTGD